MDFSIPSIMQYSKQNIFQEKWYLFVFTFSDGIPTRCPVSKMCPTWNTWPRTKPRNPAVLGVTNKLYLVTLAYWWQSYFEFLHLVLVKCNDILGEYSDSIFKVTELVWVGAEVTESKNFCQLYMKIYSIGQSQLQWARGGGAGTSQEWKRTILEMSAHISMGESHSTLPTFHSCNWPKYFRPSYVTDKLLFWITLPPTQTNPVTLKMETVYSSKTSEHPITIWYRNPKVGHHLIKNCCKNQITYITILDLCT